MKGKRPHSSMPDEQWHEEAEKLSEQLMDIANEPQLEHAKEPQREHADERGPQREHADERGPQRAPVDGTV